MLKGSSRQAFLACLLVIVSASAVVAQNSQKNDAQNQDSQKSDRDESLETLKVNVNVVQLFFNVKDKHGALIPNLTKDDFDILEDGKPQTVKYFAAESDLPLTLGILIDASGSRFEQPCGHFFVISSRQRNSRSR